jgi:hypothetical protein
VHDGVGREVDTQFAERIHQPRRTRGRVMRIGEHKGPLAAKRGHFVGNPR